MREKARHISESPLTMITALMLSNVTQSVKITRNFLGVFGLWFCDLVLWQLSYPPRAQRKKVFRFQ